MTASTVGAMSPGPNTGDSLTANRFSINMISTVTNQGKVRFMIYEEAINPKVLIRFLQRLIQGAGRKIFLILDNLRVHHAIRAKERLSERSSSSRRTRRS